MSGEQTPRWRLHRGGVVNIWQYAEQTFDFSGGRAVFQGTNGSGKSRTLELLLPLCLDGDLRHLGSKGAGTVSIRRLMLDEYAGGPNRIGYAWIELHRTDPGGFVDEYLTCGIGVKASKTSQTITDSWRFITPARVGEGFHLVGPERVPHGPAQLREVLGNDCVLDEQAFRARIAATVYGVPAARYGDLLHLQRTLRNPDVGLKVLEGQLEQILSDALPPLDQSLIERLATSFEDLESIRENIVRLSAADSALSAFLDTYRDYAAGALRARAAEMRSTSTKLNTLRSELSTLEHKLASTESERDTARRRVEEFEAREGELESSIEALRAHPAYTELQNLRDREQLVDATRSTAESALEAAERQRAQEDRSVDAVLGLVRRLAGDAENAAGLREQAEHRLRAAGLDTTLLPDPPPTPESSASTSTETVRAKPDPDAEPVPVERRALPDCDVAELTGRAHTACDQARSAETVAQERGAVTLALHQQATELDATGREVEELQRSARQAQLAATEAAGRRNQATQELSDIAARWRERAETWARDWPLEQSPEFPEPATVDHLLADRSAARRARTAARESAEPVLQDARQRVATLDQELTALDDHRGGLDDELAELREGVERTPPHPGAAEVARDPATGTPFHRLVDFAPALDEEERAGLEAALQASGLLNAWVTADGAVHTEDAELAEVFASPASTGDSGTTVSEVLHPTENADGVVAPERVAVLLASIGLLRAEEEPSTALAVSTSGRWRAGALSGRWTKSAPEFVGAGAREQARQRRIAELTDEVRQHESERAAVRRRRDSAAGEVAAAEQHVAAFPEDDELLAAHAKLAEGTENAAEAEQRSAELREQHAEAQRRWEAERAELANATTEGRDFRRHHRCGRGAPRCRRGARIVGTSARGADGFLRRDAARPRRGVAPLPGRGRRSHCRRGCRGQPLRRVRRAAA